MSTLHLLLSSAILSCPLAHGSPSSAGVRTAITSLWKVDDAGMRRLM